MCVCICVLSVCICVIYVMIVVARAKVFFMITIKSSWSSCVCCVHSVRLLLIFVFNLVLHIMVCRGLACFPGPSRRSRELLVDDMMRAYVGTHSHTHIMLDYAARDRSFGGGGWCGGIAVIGFDSYRDDHLSPHFIIHSCPGSSGIYALSSLPHYLVLYLYSTLFMTNARSAQWCGLRVTSSQA